MRVGDMVKAPADVLDYELDFAVWLPAGDTISAASATIATVTTDGDAGDAAIDSTTYSDTQAKVWISGGSDGDAGEVEVTITTTGGRTKTACFRLKVKDC